MSAGGNMAEKKHGARSQLGDNTSAQTALNKNKRQTISFRLDLVVERLREFSVDFAGQLEDLVGVLFAVGVERQAGEEVSHVRRAGLPGLKFNQ